MKEQKFSVSMCVYGGDNPEWFEESVNSILNQTLIPSEVVLVVDGPVPDELNQVIAKYESNEIFKVIRFEENRGHGDARRESIANSTNEIVAIMDADDICVPDRFEKQIKVFSEYPDVDIVGGNISEFIDNISNVIGQRVVFTEDEDIKKDMKKRCPMNQVTVMFKKTAVLEVGGYVDWYCDEDYYLWIRMALAEKKFKNIDDILVNVRVGEDAYKRRGGWKYFKSERKLQKFMKQNKVIGFGRYFINVAKRFIVQVLLPNSLRSWVFKKFARKKVSK